MAPPEDGDAPKRSRIPVLLLALGVLLALVATVGVLDSRTDPPESPAAVSTPGPTALERSIQDIQQSLRTRPDDALSWARLGVAYVEQARITGDPSYYGRSQGALDRSLQVQPDDNGEALIGLGVLRNAQHDFAAARDAGEQARELRPFTGAAYAVLADAYTQLGDPDAASEAVQSMLSVDPGLAAFARASYDLELHGRVDEAAAAMERALGSAITPEDVAFCRYYLGELSWNSGDVEAAAAHYSAGLDARPGDVALLQGTAKVARAQGRIDEALDTYADITTRVPLPQYLLEYGELAESAGMPELAGEQFAVLELQQQLYAAEGSTENDVAALIEAEHGDPGEALQLAEQEWQVRQSVFVADALAWALHVNDRHDEALEYADRAAELGWRNASLHYHRGMILAALGRDAEATAELTEALEINPHFNPLQAPRARAAIAELEAGT